MAEALAKETLVRQNLHLEFEQLRDTFMRKSQWFIDETQARSEMINQIAEENKELGDQY